MAAAAASAAYARMAPDADLHALPLPRAFWLVPENPEFQPIEVDLREQPMMIEGVVVGLLRIFIAFKVKNLPEKVGERLRGAAA